MFTQSRVHYNTAEQVGVIIFIITAVIIVQ